MKLTVSDRNVLLGLMIKESQKRSFKGSEEWDDLYQKLIIG